MWTVPGWFLAHMRTLHRLRASLITPASLDYPALCLIEAMAPELDAATARQARAKSAGWASSAEQAERVDVQSWIASIPPAR